MERNRLILVTSVEGYFERALIRRILDRTKWSVIAFSTSLDKEKELESRIVLYPYREMHSVFQRQADTCIHLGFSEEFENNSEIALKLDFSSELYKNALLNGCRLINLSTVKVYGTNVNYPDESVEPIPDSLFGMASYASEVLVDSYYKNCDESFTNLRLSDIAQSQKILKELINCVKSKEKVQFPNEIKHFSWLDIDDAVDSIIALIAFDGKWREKYNVSINKLSYSISKLVNLVSRIAEMKGYGKILINYNSNNEESNTAIWNSDAFSKDTGWHTQVDISETINKMF